jgi:Ca-activated chloride channel family protein
MKRTVIVFFAVLLAAQAATADAGLLLPRGKAQPDRNVLSLDEMDIDIRVDNGDARVFVRQIFANHTGQVEEGNYIFALPTRATVSDFAVWDGPTRIPAVILERKRAGEIYEQIKQQAIDPGLLQMGERGPEEARRTSVFSARIVPIPAFGTKRLEIEYHQSVPVENLQSYFALALRPDAYQAMVAGHLTISFELRSEQAIRNFQTPAQTYPLRLQENTAHAVRGSFEGRNVTLSEDFVAKYDLDPAAADTLQVIAYRNPAAAQASPVDSEPVRPSEPFGFFQAAALFGLGASRTGAALPAPPRTVIVLFDTSLSMQWEKLERSYEALEKLLHGLRPQDRFGLILFNTTVAPYQPAPALADPGTVQRALDFVRASRLRSGTDLQKALQAALAQAASAPGNTFLILLSDGGATHGTIVNRKLASWYAGQWNLLPQLQRPHTYIFAVGDDANMPLLKMLAQHDGVIEQVLSTEPLDFKLNTFLSRIGRSPIAELAFGVQAQQGFPAVYPLQDSSFAGSMASWVGQYAKPEANAGFTVRGVRDGVAFRITKSVSLPAQALDHPQLPRLWARARVDALLAKIEREGEDRAGIDEIIRLARQYKFVTPYTSFLAAPRALLRPRVIRPGDPVLRVKTDESMVSVVALFPFGLVQSLRYLRGEDIWQTRFLAPADMQDGTYTVRLILRDRDGHSYRESKTFVIASKPPTVRVKLDRTRFQRGQAVELKVAASASTRTLVARLEGAAPVHLFWDERARASTGQLFIPEQMPPGAYRLTVTAEDVAHNIGTGEVQIEVVP